MGRYDIDTIVQYNRNAFHVIVALSLKGRDTSWMRKGSVKGMKAFAVSSAISSPRRSNPGRMESKFNGYHSGNGLGCNVAKCKGLFGGGHENRAG
mmetsp:Transcript_10083/g.19505  ORF Transcript_10083/g.19505 Transcript_10083/m.19505 type:complete len:95 (-) Transcript_10083:253-537(-)